MTKQEFRPLAVQIVGTGHAVPHERITSEMIDARLGFEAGFLAQASGVTSRFVCTDESQIDLAVAASKAALAQAGFRPQDIGLF